MTPLLPTSQQLSRARSLAFSICVQVVKVRAWSAPILGGGLRLTVAAPGAALLLKPLLRQPLLARGATSPQGNRCPQAAREDSAGRSCQQLQHGLLTMDRTRHLISLNREAQVTPGPMVCNRLLVLHSEVALYQCPL